MCETLLGALKIYHLYSPKACEVTRAQIKKKKKRNNKKKTQKNAKPKNKMKTWPTERLLTKVKSTDFIE